ncbi:MAG: MATE family efflux transporter [Bacteroidales bacterium]|nr:MATE family efflux transporter [Bacteroidales bacterium]
MSATPSYKTIWRISYPIFLSLLAQHIIIVIDTAFLGRVGEIELGASAIGGLFYVCLFMLGFGFGTGTQILIGRRNGEKNFNQIGTYVDHSLYFLVVMGLILFFLTRIVSTDVLKFILSSENIYHASKEYLDIRIWGLVFAFINMAFRGFYIGITKTRYLAYTATLMAIVNISLDYLLIFGHFGFPEMGIRGAALASVIAEISAVVFFILITVIKVDLSKYQLFRFPKLDFKIINKILEVAGFIMIQYFVSILSWFTFFMIIEKTGERNLAASNILRSLYMIFTIPIFGLGSATNTIVSNLLGEGKQKSVLPTVFRLSILSLLSILGMIIITYIFQWDIISFYTNDPSLIEYTLGPLKVILGVLILFAVSIIIFNGVAGTANTKISLIIEIIAMVLYLSLAYYLAIATKSSIETIWSTEYLYFSTLGILSFWYLKKGNWMQKVI